MPKSQSDITSQMRQTLALTEPDLDTSIGSTPRKILDAVAEPIAEAYIDGYLLNYQYDIDSKTGADLDDFVKLFGFTRLSAKRSTGTVTFERAQSALADILIPSGTQVSTDGSVPVVAQTVVPAVLVKGDTTISVPVQAVVGGLAGNIAANSLRRRVTPIDGINSFNNSSALSGGSDSENDAQLRLRFKATIFRNQAGTEQMFLGLAFNDDAVTQANVIGAVKRHREQIELVGGVGTSTLVEAKYVYPNSAVFGSNIDTGNILTPGVHYTFQAPTVTSLDGTIVPDGIYDLEYEYVPLASRNDPPNGVTNRIDIYTNGTRATNASEMTVFQYSKTFNNTSHDPLNVSNFLRSTSAQPEVGNYFIPLAFSPVIDPALNNQIVIGSHTYVKNTDFYLVNDITSNGGTPSSLSGIEWISQANGATHVIPDDMASMSVDYVYNAVPRDVETAAAAWRLMTTDVKVHQAQLLLLDFYLAVIYQPGFAPSSIEPAIEQAIGDYISNIGFDGVVQVSDIIEVVHGVPGVDAVRFLTSSDNASHYAIQLVNSDGDVLTTYATSISGQIRRAVDVLLSDDELPVFNGVSVVAKALNTFGAV